MNWSLGEKRGVIEGACNQFPWLSGILPATSSSLSACLTIFFALCGHCLLLSLRLAIHWRLGKTAIFIKYRTYRLLLRKIFKN